MRLLDLFCGRWGWSRAFAARGWHCVGVDLVEPPDTPKNCEFWKLDAISISIIHGYFYIPWRPEHLNAWVHCKEFDFICASPPCEQFSVYGMKNFHPNPAIPEMGIKLFNHTRDVCEASGIPYVIENVRAAQQFVGNAVNHCGPFYLWGNNVPPLMPQGILKGRRLGIGGYRTQTGTKNLKESARRIATIPTELANCVAAYAEALLEKCACCGEYPISRSVGNLPDLCEGCATDTEGKV